MGGASWTQAFARNFAGTGSFLMPREKAQAAKTARREYLKQGTGADRPVVATKASVMGLEQKGAGQVVVFAKQLDDRMTSTDTTDKPFKIEKQQVCEAYKAVKSNKGAAGVDGQTIELFDADLEGNLYKIWNRTELGQLLSTAGSCCLPFPKRVVVRGFQVCPRSAIQIAQMVVKQLIEPDLDPIFLPNSPTATDRENLALDAVGVTRERCWKHDWVLEFDIRGLFDNLPHDLLLKKAVRKHVKCKWALLYIERWLTAPMEKRRNTCRANPR